jgi:hypothetical protein
VSYHQHVKQQRTFRSRPPRPVVESAQERKARATAAGVVGAERAAKITERAKAFVKEALVATSPQRLTLNRPEVMEKLKSMAWVGKFIALQGLLRLVSKMSLSI